MILYICFFFKAWGGAHLISAQCREATLWGRFCLFIQNCAIANVNAINDFVHVVFVLVSLYPELCHLVYIRSLCGGPSCPCHHRPLCCGLL